MVPKARQSPFAMARNRISHSSGPMTSLICGRWREAVAFYVPLLEIPQGSVATIKQHYVRHPDAVFLAHRKRSARHESGPGSQDRKIFADRRQNAGICRSHKPKFRDTIVVVFTTY